MDKQAFVRLLRNACPKGVVFENPGGGTSKIESQSDTALYYIRGRSTIGIRFDDMYDVWKEFNNNEITSTDIRIYRPIVFDSKHNGHSCNCTFLLLAFRAAGLTEAIDGSGVRGNPYRAFIAPHTQLEFEEAACP